MEHKIAMTLPVFEPVPSQYLVRAMSDKWTGVHDMISVPLRGIVMPEGGQRHTKLRDLPPLPRDAFDNYLDGVSGF